MYGVTFKDGVLPIGHLAKAGVRLLGALDATARLIPSESGSLRQTLRRYRGLIRHSVSSHGVSRTAVNHAPGTEHERGHRHRFGWHDGCGIRFARARLQPRRETQLADDERGDQQRCGDQHSGRRPFEVPAVVTAVKAEPCARGIHRREWRIEAPPARCQARARPARRP